MAAELRAAVYPPPPHIGRLFFTCVESASMTYMSQSSWLGRLGLGSTRTRPRFFTALT